ncbi:MAG: hypothetical protein K2N22_04030 [Clostridia bacterium]|nr:hypothetical protein [Clostridia bacterium]
MKISLFYGMKIESTAGKSGYVISVNVRGDRLEYLKCADMNENEFIVDAQNIVSYGEDKIIFEDREAAMRASVPMRLGKPVFDGNGIYLGTLSDFSVDCDTLTCAFVGKKKFSANEIVCGDAVIVKPKERVLKSDVEKDGRVILKQGTPLNREALQIAQREGEYVQANLKSI